MKTILLKKLRRNIRIIKDKDCYYVETRKSSAHRWTFYKCSIHLNAFVLSHYHALIRRDDRYRKLNIRKMYDKSYKAYEAREKRIKHIC